MWDDGFNVLNADDIQEIIDKNTDDEVAIALIQKLLNEYYESNARLI